MTQEWKDWQTLTVRTLPAMAGGLRKDPTELQVNKKNAFI